jgi:hypothetical protein
MWEIKRFKECEGGRRVQNWNIARKLYGEEARGEVLSGIVMVERKWENAQIASSFVLWCSNVSALSSLASYTPSVSDKILLNINSIRYVISFFLSSLRVTFANCNKKCAWKFNNSLSSIVTALMRNMTSGWCLARCSQIFPQKNVKIDHQNARTWPSSSLLKKSALPLIERINEFRAIWKKFSATI